MLRFNGDIVFETKQKDETESFCSPIWNLESLNIQYLKHFITDTSLNCLAESRIKQITLKQNHENSRKLQTLENSVCLDHRDRITKTTIEPPLIVLLVLLVLLFISNLSRISHFKGDALALFTNHWSFDMSIASAWSGDCSGKDEILKKRANAPESCDKVYKLTNIIIFALMAGHVSACECVRHFHYLLWENDFSQLFLLKSFQVLR